MCGIYVRINTNGDPVQLDQMGPIYRVRHRGPDGNQLWMRENVGLAHTRLAVFDTSPNGNQPMHYKNLHLVFNGAVYNHLELRKDLIKKGYEFESLSDTEVVLKAFHCYGISTFKSLIGQWAIVLYDDTKSELIVSRDRFGIKPLYKKRSENCISYASELKEFSTYQQINSDAVRSFINTGITDNQKINFFNDITEILPGTTQVLNLKNFQESIHVYHEIKTEVLSEIPEKNAAFNHVKSLLADSINLRLRADVETGISLSGGMDSNAIANLCHRCRPDEMKECFTVQFQQKGLEEIHYAQSTLEKTGYRSNVIRPEFNDLAAVLDEVVYHQDLPFSSLSVVAQYLLFREVRKAGLKVVLSGQGADELFCGYDAHFKQYLYSYAKTKPVKAAIFLIRKSFREPNLIWKKITAGPAETFTQSEMKNESFRTYIKNTILVSPLPALLRYEDRNAMAHGIESRLPFLDHRLADYCMSMPSDYMISAVQRKPLLASAMEGIVPDKILKRKNKLAYDTPTAIWMKAESSFFKSRYELAFNELNELGINVPKNMGASADYDWRIISSGLWLKQCKS